MTEIDPNSIQSLGGIGKNIKGLNPVNKSNEDVGFKEILKGFVSEVNDLNLQADEKIGKLVSGEIKDLHEVMIASTEAETSFKVMMEIRNKIMSAYKEIQRLG